MLYDLNGSKPYLSLSIYIYLFVKTCPYATYIYLLLALRQYPLNINFLGSFQSFRTAGAVLTGHVQHMARTYLTSWTCPSPGPDMSRSRISSLYKGAERPLEP
jgi:hypothetical protein